jgi:hypothetical protein
MSFAGVAGQWTGIGIVRELNCVSNDKNVLRLVPMETNAEHQWINAGCGCECCCCVLRGCGAEEGHSLNGDCTALDVLDASDGVFCSIDSAREDPNESTLLSEPDRDSLRPRGPKPCAWG